MTENILNTSIHVQASARRWRLFPKTQRRIVPSFVRNSEAMGDIFLGKWPTTTLSLITNTA